MTERRLEPQREFSNKTRRLASKLKQPTPYQHLNGDLPVKRDRSKSAIQGDRSRSANRLQLKPVFHNKQQSKHTCVEALQPEESPLFREPSPSEKARVKDEVMEFYENY